MSSVWEDLRIFLTAARVHGCRGGEIVGAWPLADPQNPTSRGAFRDIVRIPLVFREKSADWEQFVAISPHIGIRPIQNGSLIGEIDTIG